MYHVLSPSFLAFINLRLCNFSQKFIPRRDNVVALETKIFPWLRKMKSWTIEVNCPIILFLLFFSHFPECTPGIDLKWYFLYFSKRGIGKVLMELSFSIKLIKRIAKSTYKVAGIFLFICLEVSTKFRWKWHEFCIRIVPFYYTNLLDYSSDSWIDSPDIVLVSLVSLNSSMFKIKENTEPWREERILEKDHCFLPFSIWFILLKKFFLFFLRWQEHHVIFNGANSILSENADRCTIDQLHYNSDIW